jgi:3-oxoacyl-(acyl-carrier-protein) synthase
MYTPAVKSHIGDMGAAAAPFALALTIEAMGRQQIPSTRNIENEASDIDLDANTKGFRSDALRVAMINSVSKSNNSTMTICDPTAMREIPSDFNIPENLPIPELDI